MKFISKNFRLLLISLIFLISCNHEENHEKITKKIATKENLSRDVNFLKISNEIEDFSNLIKTSIENNEIPANELINKIKSIQNTNLSYSEQINELSSLLKFDLQDRIIKNHQVISRNYSVLNSKYTNLDYKTLESTFEFDFKNSNVEYSKVDCNWRYHLCISAAFAGAVLCHAGCDTTALATTAGLGIPACVAACGTLQVYASVQCFDSYCKVEKEK